MPKVRLHPLFVLLSVYLLLTDSFLLFVNMMAAIILHEFAHAAAARDKGYMIGDMLLLPYGAALTVRDNLNSYDSIGIFLAGPLMNAATALTLIAVWWLLPSVYPYTYNFVWVSLALGILNILPLYPLDGSRILINYAKNKERTLKIVRLAGIFAAALIFIFFIISAFNKINITAGIFAVFLMTGALSGYRKEQYARLVYKTPFKKDYSCGVGEERVTVMKGMPLFRILKLLKSDRKIHITVLDGGKPVTEIGEDELYEIVQSEPLITPILKAAESSRARKAKK